MLKDAQQKALTGKEMSQVSGGSQDDEILMLGKIDGVLPNASFRVELDNGSVVEARLSGKLRVASVKLIDGDRVTVKISPCGSTRGIIVDW